MKTVSSFTLGGCIAGRVQEYPLDLKLGHANLDDV